jgi:hypothetical protein
MTVTFAPRPRHKPYRAARAAFFVVILVAVFALYSSLQASRGAHYLVPRSAIPTRIELAEDLEVCLYLN